MADIRLLELRSTYKWGGGPDKTILLSAQQHDPARVTVVVAYLRDVNDHEFQITDMARKRGLTYYEILENGKFDLKVLLKLRDIIVEHDINLIHAHDYKTDFFGYLLKWWLRKRGLTFLSTQHAWVMTDAMGSLYQRLDQFILSRFDHTIAVSESTKQEMVAVGIPESKISVIHNGIEPHVWSSDQVTFDFRRELGISADAPLIGYVGRIMPEKDLETWLQAASLVAKQYPQARFVLVGEGRDGTFLTKLQELAESVGISENVLFPGYRRDLISVYGAFDIFVLSSLREGLPNSILEAMALGVPVVTTDVAGAKELVVDGEAGFVVPQQSPVQLANRVLELLDNPETLRRMQQASRHRIETEFSFAKRLDRIEKLYAKILGVKLPEKTSPIPAVALCGRN
ncbi:GT4 family glycosyltransferase PelF [Candidatus Nitronereus thalassa]|uniref:GT4 family glycosyltransferase PelF n=1 Tax=Candidatus Nitronereus thalassa TaxID=3020898 RepID=A0ABU3K6C8_9BACT|nr:GT4 family glycosyltransferase PelF [Candidatus Nitronereus thalassa]MDT7041980.1 GT4 family glycosyltransferase PelF [Candidatus Nitronereus thalassa]